MLNSSIVSCRMFAALIEAYTSSECCWRT